MFRGVANTNFPSILERFGTTRIYPNGIQHGPTRRSDAPIRHDTIRFFVRQAYDDTNRHEILKHEFTRNTNLHESTKHEFTQIVPIWATPFFKTCPNAASVFFVV